MPDNDKHEARSTGLGLRGPQPRANKSGTPGEAAQGPAPIEATAGRCYEDFEVGAILRHPLGRTVSQTDNTWFTLLTANTNPIHFDTYYSAQTEFKRPLVNSCFTLALVVGLSVNDVSRNAVNLGWDEVRLPAPVFEGDTIYAQTEVLSKRESKSRPHQGLVEIKTIGYKQDGTVVLTYRRTILVYKRGHAPRIPQPVIASSTSR